MAHINSSLPSRTTPSHNSLDGLNEGNYIHLTAAEKTYFDSIDDQLTLKENLVNKQDSLAVDGTGTKYPTVDAVNAYINTIPGQTENFNWKYNTSTVASDPGNGFFRGNNSVASLVTLLYIDKFCDQTGLDIDSIFNVFNENWEIYIQQTNDASKFARYEISGSLTNNTGWWTIPVNFLQVGTGGNLSSNAKCTFYFINKTNLTNNDVVQDAIVNGVINIAPSQNAVFDALATKSNIGHLHTSSDITNFTTAARTAAVQDNITNGIVTIAPSQNAVFDALATKANVVHTHTSSEITDFTTAAQSAVVVQTITNGDTTHAPSSDVLFDELALKTDKSTTININGVTQDLSTSRQWRAGLSNTGALLYSGATMASATTINVGAVSGIISDNETTPGTPNYTLVTYAGGTGLSVPTIGSGTGTYVLLNSSGTLVFQNTFPTSAQRKSHIYLSKISHPNLTSISFVIDEVDFVTSPLAQFRDVFQVIQYMNQGIVATGNAGLTINTTNGIILGDGINFVTDRTSPNMVSVAAGAPRNFLLLNQSGAAGGFVTTIDPVNYDVGGVTTPVGGGTQRTTIQYLYYAPGVGFAIQRGQTIYASLVDAIAAVGRESFTVRANLVNNSILIAAICLRHTTVNMNDPTFVRIFSADKFGQIGGSAAGVSVTSLQTAYNNSVQPQITTDSTRGAVVIRRGSAADTDNVYTVQNGAGTDTFLIDGNGKTTASSFVKSGGTSVQHLMADGSVSQEFIGTTTRVTHTGTAVYTRLATINIPANFIPEGSVWVIELAGSRGASGVASTASLHATFSGTTEPLDFIRNVPIGTGASFTAHISRRIIFRDGFRESFNNSGTFYHDLMSGQNNVTSVAFDRTVSNDLYIGITLGNAADTAYLDYAILRRIG